MATSRFAILAALAIASFATADAYADTRIADQIVARVDGHPIFLSEVRARGRARLARLDRADAMVRVKETQKIYSETLEERIEDEIVRALGASMQVVIGDKELSATIASIAKQFGRTPEGILAEAVAQGYSVDEYRSELRRQLLRQRVILTLGIRDKSVGPYPDDDEGRSAWLARVESGVFARAKRKACVERFVRW